MNFSIKQSVVIALVSLLLSSCAMIPKPHEIPWTHRINLHDDPRVGDFAVLAHEDNDYDDTWRVEKVDGDRVEVSRRTQVHVMGVNLDYQSHFLVGREGKVLDAWILYDNGDIEPRPIAGQGQPGGYQNFQPLAVSPGYRITTPAGEFAIDAAQNYALSTDLGLAKSNAQRVEYLSSEVPFRTVKIFTQDSFDSGALLTLLQSVALAGSAALNSTSAKVFEKTLEENSSAFDHIELKAFGRGDE